MSCDVGSLKGGWDVNVSSEKHRDLTESVGSCIRGLVRERKEFFLPNLSHSIPCPTLFNSHDPSNPLDPTLTLVPIIKLQSQIINHKQQRIRILSRQFKFRQEF